MTSSVEGDLTLNLPSAMAGDEIVLVHATADSYNAALSGLEVWGLLTQIQPRSANSPERSQTLRGTWRWRGKR